MEFLDMNFKALYILTFTGETVMDQIKNFMLKVLKQYFISNLFSTLAYKRVKIKLPKNVTC